MQLGRRLYPHLLLLAESLVILNQVDDSLYETHDERDPRPGKQKIENSLSILVEIELMNSEPTEKDAKHTSSYPRFAS